MAHIEPNVIQGLLDEVDKLERMIATCGPSASGKLQRTKIDEVRAAVIERRDLTPLDGRN